MYEDKTYENLLEQMLSLAPDDIDTRPGSLFYDTCAPTAMVLAEAYAELEASIALSRTASATGEYLDEKAKEYGLSREPATLCKREVTYEGTAPEDAERFYASGYYFVIKTDTDLSRYVEAEQAGTGPNTIPSGSPLTPVNNLVDLTSITLGDVIVPGEDEQVDESLRAECAAKVSSPAENGNKYHYKKWCEDIDGVGRAIIFPNAEGPGTVIAMLIGADGLPATTEVTAAVQEYIDPNQNGDGEGVANIGAVFGAMPAADVDINVSFTATLAEGKTLSDAQTEIEAALTEMLKNIALNTPDTQSMVVRYSAIGSLILDSASVVDYTNLLLNSGTGNITMGSGEIPVKGSVTIA